MPMRYFYPKKVQAEPKKKKKGPQPFPGSRRKRCDLRVPTGKPPFRPRAFVSNERKTAIVLWLIDTRIAVTQANLSGEPIIGNAVRTGFPRLTTQEEKALKDAFKANGAIYRPPTYKEAKVCWKISAASAANWWQNRKHYLSQAEYERSNKLPLWEATPGETLADTDPRPQVIPEDMAAAGKFAAVPDDHIEGPDQSSLMEMSDGDGLDNEGNGDEDDEDVNGEGEHDLGDMSDDDIDDEDLNTTAGLEDTPRQNTAAETSQAQQPVQAQQPMQPQQVHTNHAGDGEESEYYSVEEDSDGDNIE
ncbi:hypothetical protein GGS20DRAFT_220739 [Poronia punctata]|nr:hypothetical protein GGS20DRAFT_220739 [Poronia punctata]